MSCSCASAPPQTPAPSVSARNPHPHPLSLGSGAPAPTWPWGDAALPQVRVHIWLCLWGTGHRAHAPHENAGLAMPPLALQSPIRTGRRGRLSLVWLSLRAFVLACACGTTTINAHTTSHSHMPKAPHSIHTQHTALPGVLPLLQMIAHTTLHFHMPHTHRIRYTHTSHHTTLHFHMPHTHYIHHTHDDGSR